jgi:hypothetical protein
MLWKKNTYLPDFPNKKTFPENRKSSGSLTAWLQPFKNTFAVCMINILEIW